jgi:hypothetical protein
VDPDAVHCRRARAALPFGDLLVESSHGWQAGFAPTALPPLTEVNDGAECGMPLGRHP